MTIHTIGDSHASSKHSGWKDCEGIVTHDVGPVLCYSIGNGRYSKNVLRDFKIVDGDIVIFCFGEIDCRCHIYKHITNTKSYKMVIDEVVDRYTIAIKDIVSDVNLKHTCLYNVVPPVNKSNTYENRFLPYLGSDEERKQYVLYFNERIREKCRENDWIFFDIYDHYIDNNGFLNKSLSDGNVHIKDGKYIKEFVDKHL